MPRGRTTRQDPGHPAVHGAEAELAGLGPDSVRVDVVEDRHQLRGRRVRGQADAVGLQHQACSHRAQVLPADARSGRPARRPLPDDRRGPLIRNPHRFYRSAVAECCVRHLQDGVGHHGGVELDEPRSGGVGEHRGMVRMRNGRIRPYDRRPDTRCAHVDDEDASPVAVHDHGDGPNGEGRPSLPGLRMPAGSRLSLRPTRTSKPEPRASGRKRNRFSPMP